MAGISVRVTNDQISRRLEQLEHALGDVEPALREIGDFSVSEILRGFDEERMPWGDSWVPSMRAWEEGGKTLTDYGHLRDSYTYQVDAEGVDIGSAIVYARAQHFGRDEINLPSRPQIPVDPQSGVVDLPPHWIEEYEGILVDHLMGNA